LDDLGFGSFRKTMHWIARMGVEENTGRFKPLLEAMEDYAFYYPKNTNPLGLLTSLSWKMLVAAAQKYVEAEPYVTQAAQFPGPDYGLTDALHFQPESTYGVKVRTPLGAHAFSAWFRSQVVPRLRDAGLMTAGEFPLIEPVSSSLAYVLFQARDPAAIRRLLETYGRHEFTVELDRTSA
jgi:hypothetical protein